MHWLPGSSSQSTRPVPVTYSASICSILLFLILPSSFFRFTLASAAELSTNAALVESGGSEGSTLESGVIQPTGIEEGMEAVKIEGACSTCADGRTQTNSVLDPKCRFTLASPHDWIEITYRRAHHLRGKATPKNDDQDHPRAQVFRLPTSNPCNVYVLCCHQPPRPFLSHKHSGPSITRVLPPCSRARPGGLPYPRRRDKKSLHHLEKRNV